MLYTLDDIKEWAEYYKICKSFCKVAKKFGVNVKTVNKHLTENMESLSLQLAHKEYNELKEDGLKKCSGCGLILSVGEFEFNAVNNGLRHECRKCRCVENKNYREQHTDEIREYQKEYRIINSDIIKERDHKRHEENKDMWNKNAKKWYYSNWEEIRKTRNERHKERMANDPKYRIARSLRGRLHMMIVNAKLNKKSQPTLDYLGCSVDFLIQHLESKFYTRNTSGENMNWDNYGLYGWHIDHIKPLSSFNLPDEPDLKKACHYTNLQPLWAEDNLSKGNRESENA